MFWERSGSVPGVFRERSRSVSGAPTGLRSFQVYFYSPGYLLRFGRIRAGRENIAAGCVGVKVCDGADVPDLTSAH